MNQHQHGECTPQRLASALCFLPQVTPVLLTCNEAANISRTLSPLRAFKRVVVLDSGSTDGTQALAREFGNVQVFERPFVSHADQWNHAIMATGIQTEWVLALDADYVLPPDAMQEMAQLRPDSEVQGYRASFRYLVHGKPLRRTLYPPVTVLYRRQGARYVQDGHTQRLELQGQVLPLRTRIDHDDRKPLGRWLAAQDRYAQLEVPHLLQTPWRTLRWPDRVRRLLVVAPWLVPLLCLTTGRGALDGWAGLHYALQRGTAETLLALRLIESRLDR